MRSRFKEISLFSRALRDMYYCKDSHLMREQKIFDNSSKFGSFWQTFFTFFYFTSVTVC